MPVPSTTNFGIRQFLQSTLSRGVSLSNTFEVNFSLTGDFGTQMSAKGFNANREALENLTVLCEEASLPGMMASTGQTTGKHLGEGQINYAHTKSYQDISLSWICDASLLPVRFMNAWMELIFDENNVDGRFTRTRLNYPDTYMCEKMTVIKAERNASGTLSRDINTYTFYNVWPYTIQSTPVSYGSSQLLRLTANFYYRKWKFTPGK